MRDFAVVSPRFWTGDTGRQIRKVGYEAQLVALYLMTAPGSNMIGFYYMPLPTLSHEVGCPIKGARKALADLAAIGFLHYDEEHELVWVVEMARYQIGTELKVDDKRRKRVLLDLSSLCRSRLYRKFLARYEAPFCLIDISREAPSEGLSRAETDTDTDTEKEEETEKEGAARPPSKFTPEPLTGPLDTPTLQAEWAAFIQHRCELKKPLTRIAAQHAAQKLAEMGPQRALATLRHTMAMGWQGLREPEANGGGGGRACPPASNRGNPGASDEVMEYATELQKQFGEW